MELNKFNINQKLKNYWLKNYSVGFRKIIVFFTITIFIFLLSFFLKNYLLMFLSFVLILIVSFSIKSLIFNGYFHRIKCFKCIGEELEIVDYILPIDKRKNYRRLHSMKKIGTYTTIFLDPREKKLASYDYCRLFSLCFFPEYIKRALVLGGGGCSVPSFLARKYSSINIDVVEICPEMIKIAKKYFLKKKAKNKIHFINIDANKFVKETKQKYEFIFHDLFKKGSKLPEFTKNAIFIRKLKDFLTPDGILIINAGFIFISSVNFLIKYYKKIFGKVNIFLINGSIVLLVTNKRKKLPKEILTKQLFEY